MASNQPPVTTPAQPYGEIYDLGYKHYDGKRLGRSHAIQALIIYSHHEGEERDAPDRGDVLGRRRRGTAAT